MQSAVVSHLPIGSTVTARRITLVRPRTVGKWTLVAEVLLDECDGSGDRLVGDLPIDEISPYSDFDPATARRAWHVRREMIRLLLFHCPGRFVVIGCDAEGRRPVLSLEQALLREQSVIRSDHSPAYVYGGFRNLTRLHGHLLKHPLGLGDDRQDWPELLGMVYFREGILRRLAAGGCPAAREGQVGELNPCSRCGIEQKLQCFGVLSGLRMAYERAALECVARGSDKREPRHYHYTDTRGDAPRGVLVFMDDGCRKVVARRRGDVFVAATLYRPSDCPAEASHLRDRYRGERRKRMARAARHDRSLRVCMPPMWGY